jgi:hypothetical protein
MRTMCRIVLLGVITTAMPLWADLWTNQAGRVIEARLEAFDGTQVTLTRTNGSRLKLPIGALSQADQDRVRRQAGHSLAPAFVEAAYRDAKAVIEQFRSLPSERRTEKRRAASIQMACAVFDARLKPRL